MTEEIRVTRSTARLLRYFLKQHMVGQPVRATRAMEVARIGSGTFYPTVARLHENGWVSTEIEEVPPGADRPPRTLYRLTERGRVLAAEAVLADDRRPTLRQRIGRQRGKSA
jgi:DNA-binding PadR family transcriptional regulator